MNLGLDLDLTRQANSSGPEYLIVIAGHQSNMTGGQTTANGGTIISADDPDANIFQFSLNGGNSGTTPSHALVLEQAVEPLRYPTSDTTNSQVGPALTYAKALRAATGKKIIIVPWGRGGTNISSYVPGSQFYSDLQAAYATLKSAYPSSALHSFILSPTENEMQNGVSAASTATSLANLIAGYRALDAAAPNVPIYMGSPTNEYVGGNANYPPILLEAAKAAVTNPLVGISSSLTGVATPGDQVHYTNAGNRTRGTRLYAQIAKTAALNAAPAPQITDLTINSQLMSFTSVGAPYYDLQTRDAGSSGAWTSNLWVPLVNSDTGQTLSVTMPGSGDRDCRIVAKAYGGDSTSATVNYTTPTVTVPTPVIDLDFTNASTSGGVFVSVPSAGSDTTAWTPVSAAGTGATAAISVTTQNSLNIPSLSTSRRFRRTGYTPPAGDYTLIVPFYFISGGNGALWAWGGATTNGDIFLNATTSNIHLRHVNTTTQHFTSGSPLSGQSSKWHIIAVTYVRSTNTAVIYLNGNAQTMTGTLTQRASSPANGNSTDIYGYNTDASSNGLNSGSKSLPVKFWDSALSAAQVQKVQADLATLYAVTFG